MSSNSILFLSYDIGVESIGWAALRTTPSVTWPEIVDSGTIIFEKENCQNQERSNFRRQRRHIAATRNRIRRLEKILITNGWLSEAQIKSSQENPHPFPWFLAARVITKRATLNGWTELWPILRWYAHNRGYDGNSKWSRNTDDDTEDSQKVENANNLMQQWGTQTMAETICAFLNINLANPTPSTPKKYFKGNDAAFPRSVVENEVRTILQAHQGIIEGINERTIEGLVGKNPDSWKSIGSGFIKLPERYDGNLIFGQMIPRFENRIIPSCRITGEKVPSKDCPEFYFYRWAMLLNNFRVIDPISSFPRSLNPAERKILHQTIKGTGYFTKSTLERCIRECLNLEPINLDQMFMIPETENALILDPAKRETTRGVLKHTWPTIPSDWQQRFLNELRKGTPSLQQFRATLERNNIVLNDFDQAIELTIEERNKRKKKNGTQTSKNAILSQPIRLSDRATGRAPYTRTLMALALEQVLNGIDPKGKDGCLEETPEVILRQLNQSMPERTNNHLVRHRMEIFRKLHKQCIEAYKQPNDELKIVIEVVRDLQEYSGKTAQEKKRIEGQKRAGRNKAVRFIEDYKEKHHPTLQISDNLIRKVRIAQDLNWKCPFSGKSYCITDILEQKVDREHIIPRSWRQSDSLDSLVLTFTEINKKKGQRLAYTFIQDEGGGDFFTPSQYQHFVDQLPPRSDPRKNRNRDVIDDDLIRWRRKQKLLLQSFDSRKGNQEIQGFLPGDLTRTGYINKIAAQEALRELTQNDLDIANSNPMALAAKQIIHLPGSVTGATRRSWKLLGCLSDYIPLNAQLNKTTLRDHTHLHHALDAITAGLTAALLPKDGRLWELLSFRTVNKADQAEFSSRARIPVQFSENGNWQLADLPNNLKSQIREILAQEKVTQHLPRTMRGLKVQQNTWRILGIDPKNPEKRILTQAIRDKDQKRQRKIDSKNPRRLLGSMDYAPAGKLANLKGALVIEGNYGVILDPKPLVIPHIKVWDQIQTAIRNNNGEFPRILRNGQIIEMNKGTKEKPYKYSGKWRIRSIKDTAQGIMLQLSPVHAKDALTGNIYLKALLKQNLHLIQTDYLGREMS